MNRFKTMLTSKRFSLLVSLPANDANLARAALEEGADGLKVHLNVGHRASGNQFKGLDHYRETFREIRAMYDGPLGVVPGGGVDQIVLQEIVEMEAIGVDFFSVFAHHMPLFLLNTRYMARTFGIDNRFDLKLLEGVDSFSFDALEASLIPGEEYGKPLAFADVLKYHWLVEHSGLPVIVPTQRAIKPDELACLADCGVRGILVGAVVTGKTEDSLRRSVAAFRNAADRLNE